jgi:hypothetical protein
MHDCPVHWEHTMGKLTAPHDGVVFDTTEPVASDVASL